MPGGLNPIRNAREGDMISEILTGEASTIKEKYQNPLPVSGVAKHGRISDIYSAVAGEESIAVADGPVIYINSENLPLIEDAEPGQEFDMKIRVVVMRKDSTEDMEYGCQENYTLKINKVTIRKEVADALRSQESGQEVATSE